jgi:hypothetical protein
MAEITTIPAPHHHGNHQGGSCAPFCPSHDVARIRNCRVKAPMTASSSTASFPTS